MRRLKADRALVRKRAVSIGARSGLEGVTELLLFAVVRVVPIDDPIDFALRHLLWGSRRRLLSAIVLRPAVVVVSIGPTQADVGDHVHVRTDRSITAQ